jgi:hypothetical protein
MVRFVHDAKVKHGHPVNATGVGLRGYDVDVHAGNEGSASGDDAVGDVELFECFADLRK